MNDLSGTYSPLRNDLDKFLEDVESVKSELKQIENIHRRLLDSHEQSKTLHDSKSIKNLRSKMDADVIIALKKVKLVKLKLEALDRSNAVSRTQPDCGSGSSSDRTRISLLNGLRKKLTESMTLFNSLRYKISNEYRETVQRRYFTVTGTNPDEHTLDVLIETGESESFLKNEIEEEQGSKERRVMDTIDEIRERHFGVMEMEKSLMELNQVFLDMSVLVETQGEELNDIEIQVLRASSFVRDGTENLKTAIELRRNVRKWSFYAIVIVLLIVLLILLLTLRPWENKGGGGTAPVGENLTAVAVLSPSQASAK